MLNLFFFFCFYGFFFYKHFYMKCDHYKKFYFYLCNCDKWFTVHGIFLYTVSTVIMNFVILWTFHGIVFIIYLVNFLLTHQQFKKLKWDKNLDKNLVVFFNQTWLNSMHWEITVCIDINVQNITWWNITFAILLIKVVSQTLSERMASTPFFSLWISMDLNYQKLIFEHAQHGRGLHVYIFNFNFTVSFPIFSSIFYMVP